MAALTLIGNYVFYLLGLHYTTPANAQLLIQAAPLLMALGGILVFRERYNGWQWAGLLAIVGGLGLFFSDQLAGPAPAGSRYVLGSGLVLVGAVVWAVYALAQKQLLRQLSSTAILGFIYLVAALLLWPLAQPGKLRDARRHPLDRAGLLRAEHAGCLRRLRRGAGPLGGVAGLGGAGVDARC